MKFSIKDFFSKCDLIRSFLRILSHLLNKSLTENFIFCATQLPSSPLDLVSIDYLVDLPTTSRGNEHILNINDHFSTFTQFID